MTSKDKEMTGVIAMMICMLLCILGMIVATVWLFISFWQPLVIFVIIGYIIYKLK